MRTDYMLRQPTHNELRAAFGSLDQAFRMTAGDVPLLCFFLANPEQIAAASETVTPPPVSGAYAAELREAAFSEVIVTTFDALETPSIVATVERTGASRYTVRRVLVSAGRWPRPQGAGRD